MKRLGMAMLAAGLLAAAAAACFSDPTSDLRGSPSRLKLSRVYLSQAVGDTDLINIEALDQQGNQYAIAQPTLASSNATVADGVVLPDTIGGSLPGGPRWAAKIIAKATGSAVIHVTAAGITDSVRTTVQ